jgi:hypothetical protein
MYQLAQYVVLLRETGTHGQVSTRLQGIWREPREVVPAGGSRRTIR